MRPAALLILALLCACPELRAGEAQDARYADEVRKDTTRPEFLPALVDHLPHSASVPSPLDFLGYVPGTPGKLTYAKDVHAYLRTLADKSENVEVFTLGKSEEGREMLLVVVADAATLRALPRYKEINRRLALAEGVAGLALLGDRSALGGICRLQALGDGRHRGDFRAAGFGG